MKACLTSKYQMNRRVLSRLRAECPLLPVLLGLTLGQLLGFAAIINDARALSVLSLASVVMISSAGWRSSTAAQVGLALVVGLVQSLSTFHITLPSLSEQKPYLARVVSEPRRPKPGGVRLELEVLGEYVAHEQGFQIRELAKPPKYDCKAIDLPWRNISSVEKGDSLVLRASFNNLKAASAAMLSYDGKLLREGFSGECNIRYATPPHSQNDDKLKAARRTILFRVKSLLGNGEKAGLFLSMSLGFRDLISRGTEESFKRLGLSHLLVFSGYQVLVFYGSVVFLCGLLARFMFSRTAGAWLRLSQIVSLKKLFVFLGIVVSAILVGIVGLEASSMRAIIAATLLLISLVSERSLNLWNGIVCALLALSCIWPCSILDPGVELTFAALAGIALGSSELGSAWMRYCKTILCVWLTTTPVVLAWFGNISFMSVPANLILAPAFTFLSCNLGLGALVLNFMGLDLQGVLLRLAGRALESLSALSRILADLPWIYLELSGISRALWMLVFLLVLSVLVRRKLIDFIAKENLW